MSLITISRGSFSGGKLLAECVARQLNYRCIDRDVVVQKASSRGVSPNDLIASLETPPAGALYTLNHKKYIYLVLIQAAIAEEVSTGNAVYHGLVGHRLFQGNITTLRVRVIAPMERRVQMAQQRMNIGRSEAIAYVAKMDEQRGRWTKYLYGIDWEDPSLYDIVLNLQNLNVEQACRFVVDIVRGGGFDFSTEQQAAMSDFVLATRVRAALARDPMTNSLEVDVVSRAGQVTIKGEFCEQNEEVQRVAAAVPNVAIVSLDELAPAKAS